MSCAVVCDACDVGALYNVQPVDTFESTHDNSDKGTKLPREIAAIGASNALGGSAPDIRPPVQDPVSVLIHAGSNLHNLHTRLLYTNCL